MMPRFFNKNLIYLDYMASTPVHSKVLKAVNRYHRRSFGNPNSVHSYGVQARQVIDESMQLIGKEFGCPANSLYLTSGATESNALALQGVINHYKIMNPDSTPHVLISAIEHPSVLGLKRLHDQDQIILEIIPVDTDGVVDIKAFGKLLRPETILVSVMMVNSEIGTIQPINEINKVIKRFRKNGIGESGSSYPLLHTDASQALLTQSINLNKLHVDLLTINGHKIYAPIGVGLLYVSPTIKDLIEPLFVSDYEEKYLRPGTASPAAAVAMAEAISLVSKDRSKFVAKCIDLQTDFIKSLESLSGIVNGPTVESGLRVPTNVSVSFSDINHEFLQMQLDAAGIACATRSACLERGGEGSAVLAAITGGQKDSTRNALRFSFGYETTKDQLKRVIIELEKAIKIQINQ